MSSIVKIEQVKAAEEKVQAFIMSEADMRAEFLENDGVLDDEELRKLNDLKTKIDGARATLEGVRKEIEKNKEIWESKAAEFAEYVEKAGKLLDFGHPGMDKAVRLEVDISQAALEERWADATALLKTAQKEIAPIWKDYETQFEAKSSYDPYWTDFQKRLKKAKGAEDPTDEVTAALEELTKAEADINAAIAVCDHVKAKGLVTEAAKGILAVETILGTAPAANLSGKAWYTANQSKYPNSTKISDLESSFQANVKAFKKALEDAGVAIKVSATLRPTERAAIMHYAWMVANKQTKPADVPSIAGVDINFDHGADDLSVAKAKEMVAKGCFDIVHKPSLTSNHTRGTAIDWTLTWSGDLEIMKKGEEEATTITSSPTDGTNTDLHPVGESYSVYKLVKDAPHWSHNGK